MNDQVTNTHQPSWSVQDFLSFGYLYLLLLGIVSDSIYYGMAGINIISYSSVLDVLLSPIVRLTDNLVFPLVIFLTPAVLYWWLNLMRRMEEKKKAKKKEQSDKPKGAAISLSSRSMWLFFTGLVIFSAFIGYGLGGGHSLQQSLEDGKVKPNHRITFQDGHTAEVKLVGNNSEYVFYIMKDSAVVTVSPIKETIRSIEELVK